MSVTRKLSRMFHFFRCIPDLMAGQKYVLHDTILLPLIQRFPTATVTVNIIMSGKTWWKHGWIRNNIFCKLEGKPDYILKTSVFPIKNCRSFNLKSPEIDSSQGQLVEKILQYKNPHHLAKPTRVGGAAGGMKNLNWVWAGTLPELGNLWHKSNITWSIPGLLYPP